MSDNAPKPPVNDAPPLLGLVMIVKNEVTGLEGTLRSFLPAIDCWTILDTGSTDGTQDLIRKTLEGVPGQLVEEPFVDFATSRNRALSLHGMRSIFTIMPDGDDRLVGTEALRSFCESHIHGAARAYGLTMRFGNLTFTRPILHRSRNRPRYVGRVHECLDVITTTNVPEVVLTQEKTAETYEATRRRWERDRDLLIADFAADPRNGRTLFYLAQTYECLGDAEKAIEFYDKRIALGGWLDETFMAKLRRARLLTDRSAKVSALLDAHAFNPRRAEPLFTLAQIVYEKGEHALTYLFAGRADAMTEPPAVLFSESDIYEWRAADLVAISAFYLAKIVKDPEVFATGKRAAEKVASVLPDDARVKANLEFYMADSPTIGQSDSRLVGQSDLGLSDSQIVG